MAEEKNRLHQLIAVKDDLKKKAELILKESETTFDKKGDHFDGIVKSYQPIIEGGDELPDEIKEIVTTVAEKINYTKGSAIKAIDAHLSLEETNASGTARANLTVDGIDFGEFSAIALLALEGWLPQIRKVYKAIPTLDPTKQWTLDTDKGEGVYKTPEEIKFRTVKKNEPLVLYPATKEFPAQVQLVTNDVTAGKYLTSYKSGRITPAQKSVLLERIDSFIIAVKKAKGRANGADVINKNIGASIFDFINKDVL